MGLKSRLGWLLQAFVFGGASVVSSIILVPFFAYRKLKACLGEKTDSSNEGVIWMTEKQFNEKMKRKGLG